jgi:serine/threonine protein kinase
VVAELPITVRPAATSGNRLGRYQLVAPLGQGGMGTIYLAEAAGPADFRKLLVVKELRQDLSSNQRFVEMFLDEAKLAARLNHPNVVQTIEAGQEGGRYFLCMEFLDGQPFSAIWQSAAGTPPIALPIRLKILADALAGLHYAHTLTEYDGTSLQIVHRDVSPQNIFVTYDGQVKVVDFGIAKAAVSGAFTSPGVFKGKFGYAAPEQVRGEEVDARTDVFALGVVLWENLTMRRFSDGVVNRESVANRLAGKEPRVSQLRTKLDTRLVEICDRALAVDPAARWKNAEAFRAALDEYLVGSGQRVETAAIKRVLDQKFAVERQAVHRLIDRHIKHGAAPASHVSVVALGAEAGNSSPTQLADLSRYVSDTTNQTVVSEVSMQLAAAPAGPSRRLLAAGAAAALIVVGIGWSVLHRQAAPAAAGTSAAVQPQLSASVASPQPLVAPEAAVVAKPAPAPQAAAAQPPSGQLDAQPANVEAAGPAADEDPHGQDDRPGIASKQRRAARARPAAAAVEVEAVKPVAAPAPAAPALAEPKALEPDANPTVGGDLNRMGRSYQRRSLDTDL